MCFDLFLVCWVFWCSASYWLDTVFASHLFCKYIHRFWVVECEFVWLSIFQFSYCNMHVYIISLKLINSLVYVEREHHYWIGELTSLITKFCMHRVDYTTFYHPKTFICHLNKSNPGPLMWSTLQIKISLTFYSNDDRRHEKNIDYKDI